MTKSLLPIADKLHKERIVLVGVRLPYQNVAATERSLIETENLARSAGADVCGKELLPLHHIDPGAFLTKGKVHHITGWAQSLDADAVLLDAELSPAQQRNLEQRFELKVLDRTQVILDIFAQRAKTREGKLQVELAQLKYRLTRLTGKGIDLSRLGGGIGTRGPGEKKLEVDRRRIRERIRLLQKEIDKIRKSRATQRKRRLKGHIPVVAIIGYTNAGKSTLLNQISRAHIPVADQLFMTLDPAARRVRLKSGKLVVFSDTVGFIHKLPTTLVAAFRATLEEITYADLLLHIIDATTPDLEKVLSTITELLHEIGADEKPILTVWNKIDLMENPLTYPPGLHENESTAHISAVTCEGIHEMLDLVDRVLDAIPHLTLNAHFPHTWSRD